MTTAITEFSRRVQPDVIGCPGIMVDAAVVDSIIRLCEDAHVIEKSFEHDVLSTDIVTTDNDSVNVNIATYITDHRPLIVTEFRIDGGLWETKEAQLLSDMDDISEIAVQGTKFFSYPDRTHIKFYDINAVNQRFFIKQAFAPLDTITTVDDLFYDRYRKAVEAYARWILMSMPGKDWSNPERAEYYKGIYKGEMAMAKIRKDQGFTKGSTRVRSTRFF
ncbi:MAG: hypothetical protein A4E71_00103 [Smithella sp. PtaU1.Bin162]|nr:MAG: hypothetical protein A4E71_00103 [Smithella sp. PtaU1.Bin162]